MQLIINTILFLTRECFRRASLRSNLEEKSREEMRKVVGLSYLCLPLGMFVCLFVWLLFANFVTQEELQTPNYLRCVFLTIFASFVELLSEPMFILAQNLMFSRLRFLLEAFAVTLRVVTTYILVSWFEMGLDGFCAGQLFYAFSLLLGYFAFFSHQVLVGEGKKYHLNSLRDLFPSPLLKVFK